MSPGRVSLPLRCLALSALLAAGCSQPNSEAANPQTGPISAAVGCDSAMDAAFEAWADRGVGMSIVDVGGERQCVAAYGLADQATGRENTVDTVFDTGSITKAVTAAAVFDLIDEGVLDLGHTAGHHVDDLHGAAGESTIRDLLLHTSGISGEHGFDHVPQSKSDAIAAISNLKRIADAGTAYRYENTNYTILALVIDAVTDGGYRQYVVDEILRDRNGRPLAAGWWDGEPVAPGPRAWGYFGDEPAVERGDAPGPHWAMEGNGLIAMPPIQMAEWAYALFNNKILSPEATENLLSTSTLLAGDFKELPGWGEFDRSEFGETVYTTAGGGSGVGHEMSVGWLPESGRVIVLATNALDYDVPNFTSGVVPAMLAGTGIPGPPTIEEADPDLLDLALGGYRVGDDGSVDIVSEDGGLLVTASGTSAVVALLPVPPEVESGRISAHEQTALNAFTPRGSDESKRLIAYLESTDGRLLDVHIEGTFFNGRLVTIAALEFEHNTRSAFVEIDHRGVDRMGTREGPAEVRDFFVYQEGVFARRFPNEENPTVVLEPGQNTLTIEHPGGTDLATRSER